MQACVVCGAPEESIKHVLMDCTVAKSFWTQTRLATGVEIPQLNDVTWANDLLSIGDWCSRQDQAIILCGMWALWMIQNKHRHGELTMTVPQAVLWARDTAHDLWQLGHQSDQRAVGQGPPKWTKPAPGYLKINTDAAFSEDSKQGATASVIKDHSGVFQAAQANLLPTQARIPLNK